MKIAWYIIPNSGNKLTYAQATYIELIVDKKEELKTSMNSNEIIKQAL